MLPKRFDTIMIMMKSAYRFFLPLSTCGGYQLLYKLKIFKFCIDVNEERKKKKNTDKQTYLDNPMKNLVVQFKMMHIIYSQKKIHKKHIYD